jgi:D-alanine-D-alanine ligase
VAVTKPTQNPAQPSTEKKTIAPPSQHRIVKPDLFVDQRALKKLKLVAVAYSHVLREWFETEQAYLAEVEVEDRAKQILEVLGRLGIPAKGYPADHYFVTKLLVDDPNLVLNLVDTLKGRDVWQTSIPAALELNSIPYTDIVKYLLLGYGIPTPDFQIIWNLRTKIREDLAPPYICKLNESGGSVGIDNNAIKETRQEAQERIDYLLRTYKLPVLVEQYVEGTEVTAIVYDDGKKKHTLLAEKVFNHLPDGKHAYTSFESYDLTGSYGYTVQPLSDDALANKIERYAETAFTVLRYKDYAKFDVRVDAETRVPYITDANPNTAIGTDPLLPLTEIMAMNGIDFDTWLRSLLSKHARKIVGS